MLLITKPEPITTRQEINCAISLKLTPNSIESSIAPKNIKILEIPISYKGRTYSEGKSFNCDKS